MIERKRSGRTSGFDRARGVAGISIIGAAKNVDSSATSFTLTAPDSIAAGDMYLVITIVAGTNTMNTVTGTGLTFTKRIALEGASPGLTVQTAFSPDATPQALTVSRSGTAGNVTRATVVVLRGVNPAQIIDDVTAAVKTAITATNTPTVPGITTLVNDCMVFAACDITDDTSPTVPSGFTTVIASNFSTTGSRAIGAKVFPAAGATGSMQFTETANGPDAATGMAFAVRPLPA